MPENPPNDLEHLIHSAVFSLGVQTSSDLYDDCCSEARLAVLECAPDSTFGYRFTRARWAVSRFLTEHNEFCQASVHEAPNRTVSLENDVVERFELEELHRNCLRMLTPTERVAFTLAVFSLLPRRMIAETLGISERYLRFVMGRAFRKAQRAMHDARREEKITTENTEGTEE
jgi:DNA-directed RNA polymerase specialized sigma24 family protein